MGISETGCLDAIFKVILGKPSNTGSAMVRMMLPVTVLSAFMNNTPVVAIMIPIVKSWCERANLPPGQVEMPLVPPSALYKLVPVVHSSELCIDAGRDLHFDRDVDKLGCLWYALIPVRNRFSD